MVFLHLQTVWEAEDVNTPEQGASQSRKHKISVPVGYDAHVDGGRVSVAMTRFGTGGTPWTLVIDRKGIVRFNDVTPKTPHNLALLIENLLDES